LPETHQAEGFGAIGRQFRQQRRQLLQYPRRAQGTFRIRCRIRPQPQVVRLRQFGIRPPPQHVGGQVLRDLEQQRAVVAGRLLLSEVEQPRIGFLGDVAGILVRPQPLLQRAYQRLVEIAYQRFGPRRWRFGAGVVWFAHEGMFTAVHICLYEAGRQN